MRVGVLGIQGAYQKHREVLSKLGVATTFVRHTSELNTVALIIPGGESTTITKVLKEEGWLDDIRDYARTHPVFGTCAGAILLGSKVDSEKVTPWNIIDMTVTRNAYGRQVHSFVDTVTLQKYKAGTTVPAVFIRAPRITRLGPEVDTLGTLKGEPVLVRQGLALASTFHPELTDSLEVHRFFIEEICQPALQAAK